MIAAKILKDIEDLPSLESKHINLAQFATRLKNGIAALKSMNMLECVNGFNLILSVFLYIE